MSTYNQIVKRKKKKKKHSRSAALNLCPQREGDVIRPRIVTPRKPNSARRPVVKAILTSKKYVVAHIPGVGGHNLRKHSDILVRGKGPRDLPGVRHSCIRGVLDFLGLQAKTKRRSIYGVKRPQHLITKLRRRYRNLGY